MSKDSSIRGSGYSSNPSECTSKTAFKADLSRFESEEFQFVAKKWLGLDIDMYSVKNLPYRPCVLNSAMNSGKRRYYIEFWAYDEVMGDIRRRRISKLPRNIKLNDMEPRERQTVATYYMSEINNMLHKGWHFKADKSQANDFELTEISKMTIKEAIMHAVFISNEMKGLKSNSKGYYENKGRIFTEWLDLTRQDKLNIRKLDAELFLRFMDYVKKERKVANKTYNHYINGIHTLVSDLMKRDKKLFKQHPLQGVAKLPVKAFKHAAYSDKQMKQIRNLLERSPEKKYILRYIQFIYYTLARPNEIRYLKVGHIDLENKRILIQGDEAKGDEEYCGIPPALLDIIKEDKLLLNPPDYYVFGHEGKPGTRVVGGRRFYDHNVKILKELRLRDINRRYSLYSYKHSGALSLYLATKDIKLLQRQMRHKKVSQTEDYLRDLGIMGGYEALNEWHGAI